MSRAIRTPSEEITEIRKVLNGYEPDRRHLIEILHRIQEKLGYIPAAAIEETARFIGIPATRAYGVATFYNSFRFVPPGRHHIKVCMGTACHIKGGQAILNVWENKIGITDGQVTEDREYSLGRVACVGCCAMAPVCVVDDDIRGNMMTSNVDGFLLKFELERRGEKKPGGDESD
ncbi:NADH-quinone oxidoreductase subunit NuoE [Thermodesulfobacteriota bacterium]